jgi:hypothetical protein
VKKAESSEEESSEEEESSDEEEAPKAATNGKAKVRASPHLHHFTLVLSIRPYATELHCIYNSLVAEVATAPSVRLLPSITLPGCIQL